MARLRLPEGTQSLIPDDEVAEIPEPAPSQVNRKAKLAPNGRRPGASCPFPFKTKAQRAAMATVARPSLDKVQPWETDPSKLPKRPPGRS